MVMAEDRFGFETVFFRAQLCPSSRGWLRSGPVLRPGWLHGPTLFGLLVLIIDNGPDHLEELTCIVEGCVGARGYNQSS